ncbi:hypothetical protein CRG98_045495 [Punica granatum]|uniref:Uncharacterized protein n=1 Tax=Punica granatum TaxID=22663 RepID=A0A2I0HRP7_PUNGR|nr:hypothetical protein CRG98_045495 [Punica granatum]
MDEAEDDDDDFDVWVALFQSDGSAFISITKNQRGRRSGPPIGYPDPESTGDFDSESLVDSGSGQPIGDPDPSTEVVGVLCGPNPFPFDFSL